ncbi:hypothetical protein [Chryseobacterium sp. JUb7]|uniref:hypothetical protein n=1 Tax=Chryseobacterium sp. JUb7 TaxID=2940599 RepID=UPI0021670AFF|nr:hypothetical protein [Chryseobacterium sp. JUb7]MCS3530836.1 LIVCS family branched-chain amino acid:cation transporter [Chryseobacterium sp. JUb7]
MIGKLTFGITFLLGNICLWGFIGSMIIEFAVAAILFVGIGSLINTIILFALFVYGSFYPHKLKVCLQSILIILINLPVLLIYSFLFYN